MSFLADFSLERGKGGCLSAFVKDSLLQSRLEIFDWPKGGNARRVDFFGNKLDSLLQEGKGVIFHVVLWANGVRGRRGLGQIGLGADGSPRSRNHRGVILFYIFHWSARLLGEYRS